MLAKNDSGVKHITLEGSGSLFEPLLHLLEQEVKKGDLDISILPTGSAGGKESLKNAKIDIALSSLSSKKEEGGNLKIEEIKLAEDPVVFLYRKDFKCKNLLDNSEKNQAQQQTKREKIEELLKTIQDSASKKGCQNLTLFVREGGNTRSNLNKTVFANNSLDSIKIDIRELPENNFLAFQFFQREGDSNSLFYLPKSFYELNKEYLNDYMLLEPLEETGSEKSPPRTPEQDNSFVPTYKKELQLLINQAKKEKIKELLDQIFLNSNSLSALQLKPHLCHKTTDTSSTRDTKKECKTQEDTERKELNDTKTEN